MKIFTTAEFREIYDQYGREEISFTRMVELINEKHKHALEQWKACKIGELVELTTWYCNGDAYESGAWMSPSDNDEKGEYVILKEAIEILNQEQ